MDDEFNEWQWISNYQRARLMSEIHSSGFFAKGTDSISAGVLTLAARDAMIGGHRLRMQGQAANSGNVRVTLLAAPTGGTRTDLVYLVMYLNTVNYQSTLNVYGYQQGDTLTNDMLDIRAPGETARRVQKQWTIKTASGVSTLTDVSLGYAATSYDTNLFTKANSSTVDGVEYAVPLYRVNRSINDSPVPTLTDAAFYLSTYANPVAADVAKLDVAQPWTAQQTFNAGAIVSGVSLNAFGIRNVQVVDTRSAFDIPYQNAYQRGTSIFDLKGGSANTDIAGIPGYASTGFASVLTVSPWSDSSEGYPHQLAFPGFGNKGIYHRYGTSASKTTWAASAAHAVNDPVQPVTNNGHFYLCTVAGTAGTTEPTWPTTAGGTVTDGTVTWQENGTFWGQWQQVITDDGSGNVNVTSINGIKMTKSLTAPLNPSVGDVWVDLNINRRKECTLGGVTPTWVDPLKYQ